MGLKNTNINDLQLNPFTLFDKQWCLISAGDEKGMNTMTASWGGLGVFWSKNVATVYIRSTRYTKEFVDANAVFTVSFFPPEYRKALSYLGTVSGRNTDKITESGLTPVLKHDTVYFKEASLVLICQKIYSTEIDPSHFEDPETDDEIYPKKDYHTLYIGEIVKVLQAQ